ncbi:methyltransferase domain-containing protein [Roseibium sp.]|uniref:methyltransferase domain-containing protein n=1 Tax=Roseibium sp. TaxID=1936156 RepID=UPI003A982870
MKDDASFWDRIAQRYAKSPVRDEAAYAQTLARTRARLTDEDHVLEIGCGTGTTALKLADSVASIVATDASAQMIDIAQAKLDDHDAGNVRFTRQGLVTGAFEDAPFDAVLAFNLLHLMDDTEGSVRRIHGLLRPEGLFISKTVCLADANPVFRPIVAVLRWFGKAPLVRFLKVSQLEKMIEGAGFEIIETGTYPAKPPSRFIVARKR